MSKKHARLSPSGAYIWMVCHGQPRMVASLAGKIIETSSDFAEEGTAAHALAEHCLENGYRADRFLGWSISGDGEHIAATRTDGPGVVGKWYEVTADMVAAVQVYLNAVRAEVQPGDEWQIEERLVVSDDLWGTGDFTRYRPSTQELLIADYKHGAGKAVELMGNPQPLIYAVGKAKSLGNRGIKRIKLGIIQPRCSAVEPVRWWEFDVTELLDFWADLDIAISSTQCGDAKLVSGEHCRWCPAAPYCTALLKAAETGAVPTTGPELAEAMKRATAVKAWIKAVEDEAFAVANQGGEVPGYKLVASEGNRAWRDEAEARRMALSLGFAEADILEPVSLRSPAQLEGVVGKKDFAEHLAGYVFRPKGALKLVPSSHKAPAVNRNIRDDFQPVPAEQPVAGIFD